MPKFTRSENTKPLFLAFEPQAFSVTLFPTDTLEAAAAGGYIFSSGSHEDMIMSAGAFDNHTLSFKGYSLLNHLASIQGREPRIRPDILHRSSSIRIDIQHTADERSALWRLKSIEEFPGTFVDWGRQRGVLFLQGRSRGSGTQILAGRLRRSQRRR